MITGEFLFISKIHLWESVAVSFRIIRMSCKIIEIVAILSPTSIFCLCKTTSAFEAYSYRCNTILFKLLVYSVSVELKLFQRAATNVHEVSQRFAGFQTRHVFRKEHFTKSTLYSSQHFHKF